MVYSNFGFQFNPPNSQTVTKRKKYYEPISSQLVVLNIHSFLFSTKTKHVHVNKCVALKNAYIFRTLPKDFRRDVNVSQPRTYSFVRFRMANGIKGMKMKSSVLTFSLHLRMVNTNFSVDVNRYNKVCTPCASLTWS